MLTTALTLECQSNSKLGQFFSVMLCYVMGWCNILMGAKDCFSSHRLTTCERRFYWLYHKTAVSNSTVMQQTAVEWITWTRPAYFGLEYSGFGTWAWIWLLRPSKNVKRVMEYEDNHQNFDFNYKLLARIKVCFEYWWLIRIPKRKPLQWLQVLILLPMKKAALHKWTLNEGTSHIRSSFAPALKT